MNYNFDDYLNVVRQNIKNKKLHAPICAELESHLQDAADFYVEIGYDEVTAKYKALEDMGPPHNAAEDLAKLHKLSVWQIVAEVIYAAIFAVAMYLTPFSIIVNMLSIWAYAFSFVTVTVLAGFVLSVRHKRILPACLATILAIVNFDNIISFCRFVFAHVSGQWTYYRAIMEIDYNGEQLNIIFKIISVIMAIVITGLLIFTCKKISDYVRTPNVGSARFKRVFEFIAISALCVSLMVPVINETYINQYEYEEYEAWRSMVTEFSEYCLEHEKLTANDIDDVIEHFDYLEFKEYGHRDDYDCIRHLTAVIGEKSEAFPHLYICVMADGSIEIAVCASDLNSVWEQGTKGYTISNHPLQSLNKGDDITKFMDIVKQDNMMLFYNYDAEKDEAVYYTVYNAGESHFDNFTFYARVDSGKITQTSYDEFP